MLQTPRYPFAPQTLSCEIAPKHQRWWKKYRPSWTFPVQVQLSARQARIADTVYELWPLPGGYACRRPGAGLVLGEIYPYGVQRSLTPGLFKELSMLRAVLWNKSYPAPICYDLSNGTRVHPGPCLDRHPAPNIVRPCYSLKEEQAYTCCICNERFL